MIAKTEYLNNADGSIDPYCEEGQRVENIRTDAGLDKSNCDSAAKIFRGWLANQPATVRFPLHRLVLVAARLVEITGFRPRSTPAGFFSLLIQTAETET